MHIGAQDVVAGVHAALRWSNSRSRAAAFDVTSIASSRSSRLGRSSRSRRHSTRVASAWWPRWEIGEEGPRPHAATRSATGGSGPAAAFRRGPSRDPTIRRGRLFGLMRRPRGRTCRTTRNTGSSRGLRMTSGIGSESQGRPAVSSNVAGVRARRHFSPQNRPRRPTVGRRKAPLAKGHPPDVGEV